MIPYLTGEMFLPSNSRKNKKPALYIYLKTCGISLLILGEVPKILGRYLKVLLMHSTSRDPSSGLVLLLGTFLWFPVIVGPSEQPRGHKDISLILFPSS
jgi:hypothetical protein